MNFVDFRTLNPYIEPMHKEKHPRTYHGKYIPGDSGGRWFYSKEGGLITVYPTDLEWTQLDWEGQLKRNRNEQKYELLAKQKEQNPDIVAERMRRHYEKHEGEIKAWKKEYNRIRYLEKKYAKLTADRKTETTKIDEIFGTLEHSLEQLNCQDL